MSGWCIEGLLLEAMLGSEVQWGLRVNNESGQCYMDFAATSAGGGGWFNLLPEEQDVDRLALKNLQQNQQLKDALTMLAAKPSIENPIFTLHDAYGMNYYVTSLVNIYHITAFYVGKVYPQFKTKLGKKVFEQTIM